MATTRWVGASWTVIAAAALAACSSSGSSSTASAASDGGVDAATKDRRLAAQHFDAFAPFASPIGDFLAVGRKYQKDKFNASITELTAFGGRLFFGYGDADYNLGEKTPIEMRAFSSDDDANVVALPITADGQGAAQKTPTASGEEQIDRYRVLGGELYQAGIDSIDPDELWTQANTDPKRIQGNVYRLAGDRFEKHRSIWGGEHVHDLALWKGALYSVGSGADVRTEFEAGRVFRYLWRSDDHGATFTTVTRVEVTDPGNADTRWVHLLATNERLFLFGYQSDYKAGSSQTKNAAFDGTTLTPFANGEPLQKIFPDGTLALSDGTGLLWGINLASPPNRNTTVRVRGDGSLTPIEAFRGSTVLDVAEADGGELVFLTATGDDPAIEAKHWDVRVLVADAATLEKPTELLHFETDVRPTAVAAFGGALFLGTADGHVLRATPAP